MNKLGGVCKISHMAGPVTVAGKNNGKLIFPAAAENFPAAGPCVASVTVGGQGRFIDLKNHILFLRVSGENVIIYRITGIVTMPQDLYLRMPHGADIRLRVLLSGAGGEILDVHTDNGVVQEIQEFFPEILPSVSRMLSSAPYITSRPKRFLGEYVRLLK